MTSNSGIFFSFREPLPLFLRFPIVPWPWRSVYADVQTTSPIFSLPLPWGLVGIFVFSFFIGVFIGYIINERSKFTISYTRIFFTRLSFRRCFALPQTTMTHAFPVASGCRFKPLESSGLMSWSSASWERVGSLTTSHICSVMYSPRFSEGSLEESLPGFLIF